MSASPPAHKTAAPAVFSTSFAIFAGAPRRVRGTGALAVTFGISVWTIVRQPPPARSEAGLLRARFLRISVWVRRMARGPKTPKGSDAAPAAAVPDGADGSSSATADADAPAAAREGGGDSRRHSGLPGWAGSLVWAAGAGATVAVNSWFRAREVKRLEAEEARVRADVAHGRTPARPHAVRTR